MINHSRRKPRCLAADPHAAETSSRAFRSRAAGARRGGNRADLVDAGLEELRNVKRLARLRAHLGRNAGAAARIDLGLRHPDGVLIRHAHREVPADLAQQAALGARCFVDEPDRRQPVDIELRVFDVLIGDQPTRAFLDHVAGGGRHHCHDLALEIGERGGGAALAALRHPTRSACLCGLKAGPEAAQIGLHSLTVGADRALDASAGIGGRSQPQWPRASPR